MKPRRILLFAAAWLVLVAARAFATPTPTATGTATATPTATPSPLVGGGYLINGGGAQTPKPVGTSTPVVILKSAPPVGVGEGSRCDWEINWAEAGDLMCMPITYAKAASDFAPSSTVGFRMTSANRPWGANAVTDDTTLGWECVSTSGTLNIYVYEAERCTKKGDNP